jgi:carbamoyltransferase
MDVFTWNRSNETMFDDHEMFKVLGGIFSRHPDDPITQDHKDLAAAVQKRYEELLFLIVEEFHDWHGSNNLCLGGGCAYNGLANGKILENTKFEHLWIPPAPSDAGSSIGACLHYLVKNKGMYDSISKNPFLGPIYENYDIEAVLNKRKIQYSRNTMEKVMKSIACDLKKGKVVGWYQGHIEFGARALGNRSILADPTTEGMKDRINKVIKKRESFRPFAPMVIKERQNDFFEMVDDVPYMNQVVKVKPEYVDKLKAVTHVDGTARVQTVYPNTLPHTLLLEFEKLTGYPILLNTSFNVKDKTMVLTPEDALDTFFDTDMDILVMNNFVIRK